MSASLLARYRPSEATGATEIAGARLHIVLRYIREHISDNLQLDTLAELANTTSDNFRRLFKHVTGVAPHHYIVQQRVEKAKRLLGNPDLSIAEIAHAVGFSNQAHLTTVFRKFERTSPNAYRKQLP